MAQEILRRQEEQALQARIAQQQRIDAMFARLNSELKLEGVPFNLSLKKYEFFHSRQPAIEGNEFAHY